MISRRPTGLAAVFLPLSVVFCSVTSDSNVAVDTNGKVSAPASEARIPENNPRWLGLLDQVGPFHMRDLRGREWTERDFLGKIVVVRLWSAHCGPCVVDFPQVQKFHESLKRRQDVVFVSLNLDVESAQISAFMGQFEKEYSFPVLFGRSYFKIGPVPYTWILDRQGYLRDVYIGAPPDWQSDTLQRAEAVARKPSVASLPPEVRARQQQLNEEEAARAVQLKK